MKVNNCSRPIQRTTISTYDLLRCILTLRNVLAFAIMILYFSIVTNIIKFDINISLEIDVQNLATADRFHIKITWKFS